IASLCSRRAASGEIDLSCRLGATRPPRGRLESPVPIGVGNDLLGVERQPPLAGILGGVGVSDKGGVVAAEKGAVKGAADAGVGRRARHDEVADLTFGKERFEVGLLERITEMLV